MINKKVDIGLRYIMIFLLTSLLIVSLSFGWYVTNKTANASGITATSSDSDLKVSNHAIYKEVIDTPYPDDKIEQDKVTVPGLLSGDKVYYSISLKSLKYDVLKKLSLNVVNVDGGEFFTCPPILHTVDPNYPPEDTGQIYTRIERFESESASGTGSEAVYEYKPVEYHLMRIIMDPLLPKSDTNEPISNGLFYIRKNRIDGLEYRHYIYEHNNKSINTCDLYKIRLYDIFTGNDTSQTELLNQGLPYREEGYRTFTKADGLDKNIKNFNLLPALNSPFSWTPTKELDTITFKFEIVFDIELIKGSHIDTSSVSNREFIFDNILIQNEGGVA